MARLSFDPFPRTTGVLQENKIELIVSSPFQEELKSYLTARNKSAAWQIERLKNQRVFSDKDEQKRKELIQTLTDELIREYWAETPGGLSVPAGFWYLCDRIENEQHINHDIPVSLPDWLRPYQRDDLTRLLRYKRATMYAATGLGKTACIIGVTICAQKAGKRTCIIVPTIDLVRQTVDSCRARGLQKVSGAGGTYIYQPGCEVLVTTVDSAYKYIDVFDVVCVDENHHASASTWFKLLAGATSATHVYGFSATPYRTDGLDLGIHAWCGPIVTERTADWGIKNGWLAEPKIFMARVTGLPYVKSKTPLAYAYQRLATHKKFQDFLLKQIKNAMEKHRIVMVIFSTVKAGEAFRKFCVGKLDFDVAHAKFRAPFIHFKEGKTNLLVGNVKLFGEGVDVPRVSCIITVCNNNSEIITRQVIGRAMRIAPGKKDAIVIDIGFDSYEPYVRAYENRIKTYRTITDSLKEIVL